ncbi:MAG: hypothetical protein ABIJ92_01130 [Candidatus Aenigmatarchaeota archaeon]
MNPFLIVVGFLLVIVAGICARRKDDHFCIYVYVMSLAGVAIAVTGMVIMEMQSPGTIEVSMNFIGPFLFPSTISIRHFWVDSWRRRQQSMSRVRWLKRKE